jgi:competence protein ComEC
MYWFQQGTALGLPANLVAIPWVSLVVVPLVLAGAACLLLGWPAGSLLELAADAGQSLTAFLSWLAGRFPDLAWATPKPGLPGAALAVAGLLLLLLPRGMRIRWLAPFLCVPLEVRVELLDVGQGLAALVDTRRHTLLYDSGPGKPGEWDLARTTIRPAMATRNTRVPKLIVISHGDMDHAGGLGGLRRLYPHVRILGNLGEGRIGCTRQLRWSWDGVGFRVLHPGPRLPYLGNASSCVMSVVAEQGAVLLPGDVDAAVEARLLRENIGEHELVVAPHHGSRTSSTPRWVERLRPRAVLFAAGPGNRFGFPDPGVVQRYLDAGALALSTADCGAIRVAMKRPGALELASARRARPAPWRWPPAPHCP